MAKVDAPLSTKDFVDFDSLVNDDIALEIRRIITGTHMDALRKWDELMPALVHSAVDRLTINNLVKGEHISSAIITTLQIWCSTQSKNATFTSLIKVFRETQLNALADELEENVDRLSRLGARDALTMDTLQLQESPILYELKDCIQDGYFFKRPSAMKRLSQAVTRSYLQKYGSRLNLITALTGRSEIGKTALVRKFISEQLSQNANFPRNVIWFAARDVESLRTSLGSFLQQYLDLSPPRKSSTNSEIIGALGTIYEWLRTRKVLIVFDGVDSIVLAIITEALGALKSLANHSNHVPSIIITTRLNNVTAHDQEIQLSIPDKEEVSRFLDERVRNGFAVNASFKPEFQRLPMAMLQIFQLRCDDWDFGHFLLERVKFDANVAQTSLPWLRSLAYFKYGSDDSISWSFLKIFAFSNQDEFSRLLVYLLSFTAVQESATSVIVPYGTRLCIRSNLEKDIELRILTSMMQTFERIPVEKPTSLEVIEQSIHFILLILEQNMQISESRKVQFLIQLLKRVESSRCFHQSLAVMDYIIGELTNWSDTVSPIFTQSVKDSLADTAKMLNAERLAKAARTK